MEEKLEQIKERVTEQKSKAITMSRVPIQDYEWFIDFAKEFADDYGMAFKRLIDVHREMYPPQAFQSLAIEVMSLREEIETLKHPVNTPTKIIKTVGGKEIRMVNNDTD